MSKVILIGISVALGLGAGVGLDRGVLSTAHTHPAVETSAEGSSPSAPLQGTLSASTGAVSFDLEPMRALLREELGAALAHQPAISQTRAAAPDAVPAASPQQQREALQAVDGLVTAGRWGNEERSEFHQKLAMLSPQQREDAMQTLVQALNNGSLKVSTNGPPL